MNNPNFAELAEVLRRRAIPAETIVRGDRMQFGVATVEVTIFDGESSDTATSTVLGSNCSSSASLQSHGVMVESAPSLVPDRRKRRN